MRERDLLASAGPRCEARPGRDHGPPRSSRQAARAALDPGREARLARGWLVLCGRTS
jgi:hypothetical protein